MFIKPARENLIVRDPSTVEPLPIEGKKVKTNLFYWQRRIMDGDVIEVSIQNKQESKSVKTTKAGGKS
jgi:hypothetical protein